MTDPGLRIVPCDACNGEGGSSHIVPTWDEHGAIPYGREVVTRCEHCDGTGEMEVEAEPRTLEDIEDEEAEEAGRTRSDR